MFKGKRKYGADFKMKVALTALKEDATLSQLCSQYEVHVTQIHNWKKQAITFIREGFLSNRKGHENTAYGDKLNDELYKQIGQLKVELDWLKKKAGFINSS